MTSWLGQYCINVSDLERTVALYESLGLTCTSRTSIDAADEAIVEHPGKGGKIQLAQQRASTGPIDMGNALWKLYINTNDIQATFDAALSNGCTVVSAPERAERWPVTIAFVTDPDGYTVEFVERHPWLDGDTTTPSWVGQYCINVSDIDATIAFYERLGFSCTSRTDIPQAKEAIIENPAQGGKLQLAQQLLDVRPISMGTAMWKLYVHTDDLEALHASAVAAGYRSVVEPMHLTRWPTIISFLADPDGYQVELVQRLPD
ncbi:MAG: putative lactoylglutathione lyase, chloroplastic [Ilumatobacteraceae bacterium]|nr:putative lactoylglutathione lyase, chloroplastic [Ilumatobacteraceae bacterium]